VLAKGRRTNAQVDDYVVQRACHAGVHGNAPDVAKGGAEGRPPIACIRTN
jgi:hypothetical protein